MECSRNSRGGSPHQALNQSSIEDQAGRNLSWGQKESHPTIKHAKKRHFHEKDQFIHMHNIFPSDHGDY